MTVTPDSALLDDLAGRVSGRVLRPADDGYDAARRVHNGLIDRAPAVIIRCRSAADVAAGVRFARAAGLDISVRGGGHNVAGRAVADDAVMIDLAEMKGTESTRRPARCGQKAVSPGRSSTAPRPSTGSQSPAAPSLRRGSPGSRSAAGSVG